eukprot:COSAG01_NODE_5108_length_4476_cov_14.006854_2_plen_398_part_00
MNHTTGPLGCSSSWRDASGNYTTTIEVKLRGRHSKAQIGFFTSSNYKDWSFVGVLKCPICELCVRSCSSFYPAPDSPPAKNRWVFGVNSGGCKLASGGMITGTFDRASLTFLPDKPWATSIQAAVNKTGQIDRAAAELALHFSYDYGPAGTRIPKSYRDTTGRRIVYGWIGGGCCPGGKNANQSWQGMQSVPRLITPSAADDATTSLLSNPVPELERLRGRRLVSLSGIKLSEEWQGIEGATGRYLDVIVTFHGLVHALGPIDDARAVNLSVNAFAPPGSLSLSWRPLSSSLDVGAGARAGARTSRWVEGWVSDSLSQPSLIGTPPGGPLALRRGQDSLSVRVLKDGSVCEAFWDGGRARQTARIFANTSQDGLWLRGTEGVTADVDVYEMRSAWIE